jgi:hypothetical protein
MKIMSPKMNGKNGFLTINPFEGDFGEQDDVTFKDRLVRARKEYTCIYCCGIITKGEHHRYFSMRFGGVLQNSRYCYGCCDAMAASWVHNEEEPYQGYQIEQRHNLHRKQT